MTRFLTAFLLALATLSAPARAADPDAALVTATKLIEGAHAAMTARQTEEARNAQLKAVIAEAFAFDIWQRFLLGDRRDRFTEAQVAEFRDLLPGFLANLYAEQFGRGLEQKPVIDEARSVRNDVLVRAGIPRANGRTLPVDYRIRDFGGDGHKVIDTMVGGTSFLILKRDEFGALIDRDGPGALIAYMRENSI